LKVVNGLNARENDLVVAGAGIVGLACAWRAAQAGMSVLVLERGEPGAQASAVAAGMLAPITEATFGEEELLRLNVSGRSEWPAFAAELSERSGIDLEYRDSGALVVAADRDDVEELRRLNELQRSLGLDARWLTGRECRRLEPGLSPRIAGRVTGVATAAGPIAAPRVLVACGAWSGSLHPAAPPVRPVKGQLVRLRGAPLAERVIRTPRCYVVCRPSGEIVIGATVEERGFDTTVTAGAVHRLLEAAWEVLPDVEERELVAACAGLRPGTPDNRPVIGPAGPEGLLWATGHHRSGVLLAPLTATEIVRLLAGRTARLAGSAA
jgi:glycine oxidase